MTNSDLVLVAIATGVALLGALLGAILLALVHGVIVRRLHRASREPFSMGLDLVPGMAALNVAAALSRPPSLLRVLAASPYAWLVADSELLLRSTSQAERTLARVTYRVLMFSGLCLLAAGIVDKWGLVDGGLIAQGLAATFALLGGAFPSALTAFEDCRVQWTKPRQS